MDDTQKRNLWIGGGIAFLVIVAIALFFAFRGGGDEEVAVEPTPEPSTEAITPTLRVDAAPVDYRASESDELEVLDAGASFEIEPGANVIVGDGGSAVVDWPEFLENELLGGTDWLLSLSLPGARQAILDQATGTARYRLGGAGEAASVEILSQWLTVLLDEGEADLIVSLVPGEEPSVWVAAMEGEAQIIRGEETLTLGSGQVAGFTDGGEAPELLAADLSKVGAWYDEVKAGTATGSIASVAYRCVVAVDEVTLLAEPNEEAETVGEPLFQDTTVSVLERDEDGVWLLASPLTSSELGWVLADSLSCNGPADALPYSSGDDGEAEPTATSRPLPTRPLVPFASPTPPLFTPTPTRTPTPSGEAKISFSADDDEIDRGDCTTLRWSVENIQAVYLDGEGVTGQGERRVCPEATTTYTLEVVLLDGSRQSTSVEVEVNEPDEPTNTPQPTQPPATAQPTQPPATAQPTQPPATAVPTSPPATDVPTAAPTDEPDPTPEPTTEP